MVLDTLKTFFWVVPFIAFLSGYQLVRFFSHTEAIEVPSIVGMHIHDAIRILSADKLNVRILEEKNDPDAQEGIIISQAPSQGQKVKPHQSIFLVLTRRPPKLKAPSFYGLTVAQAQSQAKANSIELKLAFAENNYPKGTCFAQSISAGQELAEKSMTIYCSSGLTSERIFPNLIGKTVEEARSFLDQYGATVSLVNLQQESKESTGNALIKEQRPLAGSIVDLSKKLQVHLTIS